MTDFGTLLRVYRLRSADSLTGKSLSQQRLGGLLREELGVGFSGAAVSDWERGESKIYADDRLLLVNLLKVLRSYTGIQSLAEANELLAAGNYRALNPTEIQQVFPQTPSDLLDPSSPPPSHSQRTTTPRLESVFFDANEGLEALLAKAREGPPPAWPRMIAALLRSLSDRLTARGVLRALLIAWLWLLTRTVIMPSLRWPFADRQEMLWNIGLYVAGTLTLPAFIGLLAETKNNQFWQKNQLSNSLALRLYTHQGAYIGFHLGYYAVFIVVLIWSSLSLPITAWFELTAMLAPLGVGFIGARVIPYNLWRAFGRLDLRDGSLFFVFVLLGPLWGFFLIHFFSLITSPAGLFIVLFAVTLLASGMAWQTRKKKSSLP